MVAQALTGHARPPSTPCHGSFKPSQLLLGPAAAVVTDLDHACVAEPALDVGCFLAYLRPAAVWRRRCTRARAWYDHAAGVFSAAYAQGMEAAGAGTLGRVALERAPAYEGALILKIAARRPHRVQSLRPLELSAMLDEAARRAVGEGRR
jgi:hypothetical protein